jgi:hypothetical protein
MFTAGYGFEMVGDRSEDLALSVRLILCMKCSVTRGIFR